jgi:hypothetical protein
VDTSLYRGDYSPLDQSKGVEMKLSLNIQKLNSVASITTGLSKMVEDLRKLIETKDREIEVARSIIIEKGLEVHAARTEIDKAQNVMKNISALIEEKNE